jgi:hypothetical protein
MNTTNLISSEQVSQLLTTYRPATIRELAKRGVLPVDHWEPMFKRDAQTIRALLRLVDRNRKTT